MATYEEIYGKRVKEFDSDPTLESSYEGQVWYDKSSGTLKSVVAFASWTSASNMISAKTDGGSLPGSPSTYGLAGGGSTNGSWTGVVNNTFSWNGSGWASEPNMNVARNSVRGDGTSTSALFVGGIRPPAATYSNEVESWNGSSWTAETAYPQAINQTSVAGTETAAVSAGGYDYAAAPSTGGRTRETFEYNGSSWTAQNNKPFGASNMGSAGTQTASIFFGGFGQPGDGTAPASPSSNPLSSAEEYDGTNWTTAASLNVAKYGITGSGNQTDAGGVGGHPYLNTFERYDGSSWTQSATLATGRTTSFSGGLPASTDGSFVGGGKTPTVVSSTETFVDSINTITAAAWSSGTALPGVRWNTSGAGTQTAGLVFGGSTGPATPTFLNTTFEYDGSSWTGGGSTPISTINQFSAGTQTAAIGGGGYNSGNQTTAYTYNGSTWTTITATPFGTKGAGGAGTSTAALIYGSDISPSDNQDSYSWNGSSWSEEGALNNTFQNGASGGPSENTAFAAGSEYSPAPSTRFETYNGTAWTSGPALNIASYQNRGFGSSTSCLSIGGYNKITTVEQFNGTSWGTSPALGTGRKQFASANFTAPGISNGWVGGGADGDSSVEHFTEETETVTASTLTSS